MDVRTAFALYQLKLITGEELTQVATESLLAGSDSPAARQLAGLNRPTLDDAAPLFLVMTRDEGLDELGTLAASVIAGVALARDIVEGGIGPREGAAQIERVWQASGHRVELSSMAMLSDEYLWDEPRAAEVIDADVVAEAKLLVERYGTD